MIHKLYLKYILVGIVVLITATHSQSRIEKKGGICFRVDDNQDIRKMTEVASLFNKYGYKCSFSINVNALPRPDYLPFISQLQNMGHEIMDHTPNHTTNYFLDDKASQFLNKDGVDHVVDKKICLAYQFLDSVVRYEVFTNGKLINGRLISAAPKAFSSLAITNYLPQWLVYFPSEKKLCTIEKIITSTRYSDTINLKTIYGEELKYLNIETVNYQFIKLEHVRLTDAAFQLLIEKTRAVVRDAGLKMPITWIQPGGNNFLVTRNQLKNIAGGKYNYIAAASSVNSSIHCYQEYDPNGDAAFGMQWGDFYEDFTDLATLKKKIAYGVARNYVLIGHNHFTDLLGGWDGYINRLDSLLDWCKNKKISVRTYSDWAKILYDDNENPYQNIMPPLNIDNDQNGIPDGYYQGLGWTDGVLGKDNSLPVDDGVCYTLNRSGSICYVSWLGGVEKGENSFSFWMKSYPGNTVEVQFLIPGYANQVFKVPSSDTLWHRIDLSQLGNGVSQLIVPENASYISIRTVCTMFKGGPVQVGGYELRKKNEKSLVIISTPDTVSLVNSEYSFQVRVQMDPSDGSVDYSLIEGPKWLEIDSNGLVTGRTPSLSGKYPVKIIVKNNADQQDTLGYSLSVLAKEENGYLRVVSIPETLSTPGYSYFYKVEVGKYFPRDSLQFTLVNAPNTFSIDQRGLLEGKLPNVIGKYPIKITIADEHGNSIIHQFEISTEKVVIDNFEDSIKNITARWIPTTNNVNYSIVYDEELRSNVFKIESDNGISSRIDRGGLWRPSNLSLWIKPKSKWVMYVWCIDSSDKTFNIAYTPQDGNPVKISENILFPLGVDQGIGWRYINRDIYKDLESVHWGSTVLWITGVQFRGSLSIDEIILGNSSNKYSNFSSHIISGKSLDYQLFPNYPNPFNPSTIISFSIPEKNKTTVEIFDTLGRNVFTILNEELESGHYSYEWSPSNIVSGVYFCRLSSGNFQQVRKLIYLK